MVYLECVYNFISCEGVATSFLYGAERLLFSKYGWKQPIDFISFVYGLANLLVFFFGGGGSLKQTCLWKYLLWNSTIFIWLLCKYNMHPFIYSLCCAILLPMCIKSSVLYGAYIATLAEHDHFDPCNLRVADWSPALGTCRHRLCIDPAAKWVSGICTRIALWLFTSFAPIMAARGIMLHRECRWCRNVQVQSRGKIMWVGLTWNKTFTFRIG